MYKQLILLSSFLLITLTGVHGQTDNQILSSYQYQVIIKNDGKVKADDICQLDITKTQSYFYSLGYENRKQKMAESFAKAQQTGSEQIFTSKDYKTNIYPYFNIKNYNTKEAIVSERINVQQLATVQDTLSSKGWVITKEKKVINNLNCYKAQIKKGNVITTAWFTPSIATQEGPFNYYGLPGLIVSLSNSNGWEAQLIKMNTNNRKGNELKIPRYTLISDKQMEKAKKNAAALSKQGIHANGDRAEKSAN